MKMLYVSSDPSEVESRCMPSEAAGAEWPLGFSPSKTVHLVLQVQKRKPQLGCPNQTKHTLPS